MEEKTKIKGCKRCFWRERQGKHSSCKRKLPDHIPESARLKYNFMLVEKYNNKLCHNFLHVLDSIGMRYEVPVDTKRKWE